MEGAGVIYGGDGRRPAPAPDPVAPVPALAPLRVAAYRRVWCALTVSHLGTYLQLTVAPWLMYEMTGSPLLVSLITTALFLPRLVLTLPAGALSDRFDRRTLMLVSHGVSCSSAGALAVLTYADRLTPSSLLGLTLALGVGSAIGTPSYQTFVPDLVPRPLRAQAITLNSGAHQAARIVGPSIGGLLVALQVAAGAFAGNAISFALVMGVLLTLPRGAGDAGPIDSVHPREGVRGARADSPRRTVEGIRFVRAHPGLRRLLLATAGFTLPAASVQALLPSVVADDLGLDATGFGLLYGIFGAGALAATVTRERAAARSGARLLPGAMVGFAVAAGTLGWAPNATVAAVALVGCGVAWVWTMTTLNATVQLLAPRWIRGRVVSLYVLAVAMKPVGAFVTGSLAEIVGAGAAVVHSSIAIAVVGLFAARARLPVLRDVGRSQPAMDPEEPRLDGEALAGEHGPIRPTMGGIARRGYPGRARPVVAPGRTTSTRGDTVNDATVELAGRRLPALGLGCMSMSHPGRSDAASVRVLRAAFDAGVRVFDTAEKYGAGHNEQLVARALGSFREEVFIATKVGFVGSPSRDANPVDGSPQHIRTACEASLRRLQTDRLDLLYLHRVDPHVPIEESVGAMAELVASGHVAHLGLSEVGNESLARAQTVHPIAALQTEYSLWTREAEQAVLPACRASGVSFVAYSPLGVGFLTGRYRRPDDLPAGNRLARQPRMEDANLRQNLDLVEQLRLVAERLGCTPAQLALAWVLDQGVLAIPGSSQEDHLHENLGAAQVHLDTDAREALDRTFHPERIAGARKSPDGLALTGR